MPPKKRAASAKKGSSFSNRPVDSHFPQKADYKVYGDAECVYDCMLNQADVGKNANKFYVIQLLQNLKQKSNFRVWTRWGRVGVPGQNADDVFASADLAIKYFAKKFKDKTSNDWDGPGRNKDFNAKKGKYTLIEMDYDDAAGAGVSSDEPPSKRQKKSAAGETGVKKSILAPEIQKLVARICDKQMLEAQLQDAGCDIKKMPLGKISPKMIKDGYAALQKIQVELDKKKPNASALEDLTSSFFTVIPHNIGFKKMKDFTINTNAKLKTKIELVESLQQIEQAVSVLDASSKNKGAASNENPFDQMYRQMDVNLQVVKKSDPIFKLVDKMVKNTHGKTHTSYKLEVLNVFAVEKTSANERFVKAKSDKMSNRQLLWHGSRLTNWCGILSQGLRIAPPEAPVTGYMFGKGVYFANMVSKSANYCFTDRKNNVGLMLLEEVALGTSNELKNAKYDAHKLPKKTQSTHGVGRMYPTAYESVPGHPKDLKAPVGSVKDRSDGDVYLLYDEKIIYQTSQSRPRFLVEMKFNYK